MNKCDINWRMRIGHYIRKLGRWISGPYWVCTHCGWIKFKEEEVLCWECGLGEMIYQGDLPITSAKDTKEIVKKVSGKVK